MASSTRLQKANIGKTRTVRGKAAKKEVEQIPNSSESGNVGGHQGFKQPQVIVEEYSEAIEMMRTKEPSPVALLDMLAEVASATLKSDPVIQRKSRKKAANRSRKPVKQIQAEKQDNKKSVKNLKKVATQSEFLSLDQIRMLSDKLLLNMFSELTADEIRRNYSYMCYLVPDKCQQMYTSFGNETRSRQLMKTHLLGHIAELLAEANSGRPGKNKFTAEPLHVRKKRIAVEDEIKKRKRSVSAQRSSTSKSNQSSKSPVPMKKSSTTPVARSKKNRSDSSAKAGKSTNKSSQQSSRTDIAAEYKVKSGMMGGSSPKSSKRKSIVRKAEEDEIKLKLSPKNKKDSQPPSSRVLDASSASGSEAAVKKRASSQKSYGRQDVFSNMPSVLVSSNESWRSGDINKNDATVENMEQPLHDHCYTLPENFPRIVKQEPKHYDDSMSMKDGESPIEDDPEDNPVTTPYEMKSKSSDVGLSCSSIIVENMEEVIVKKEKNDDYPLSSFSECSDEEMVKDGEDDNDDAEWNQDEPPERHKQALGKKNVDKSGKKSAKMAEKGSPEWERKLALKWIRYLRTKKKDERVALICKICKDKTFTAMATLMYHYRSHAGIKPFVCNICNTTFTRQHSLNYHMLIHSNKSRFTCADCGRKFRHPSHFKEHLRRHTGETPFECSDCGLRFKTRNTYKRHLKTRHGKLLTMHGIVALTAEEFLKVRTTPKRKTRQWRDKQTQWPDNVLVSDYGLYQTITIENKPGTSFFSKRTGNELVYIEEEPKSLDVSDSNSNSTTALSESKGLVDADEGLQSQEEKAVQTLDSLDTVVDQNQHARAVWTEVLDIVDRAIVDRAIMDRTRALEENIILATTSDVSNLETVNAFETEMEPEEPEAEMESESYNNQNDDKSEDANSDFQKVSVLAVKKVSVSVDLAQAKDLVSGIDSDLISVPAVNVEVVSDRRDEITSVGLATWASSINLLDICNVDQVTNVTKEKLESYSTTLS